jgi:hypothetical protein
MRKSAIQKVRKNRSNAEAVAQAMEAEPGAERRGHSYFPPAMKSSVQTKAVAQRAITAGSYNFPRSESGIDSNLENYLNTNGLKTLFLKLNDDHDTLYIFTSGEHLVQYLHKLNGDKNYLKTPDPETKTFKKKDIDESRKVINDLKFNQVYKPQKQQFDKKALGLHKIDEELMPPVGEGNMLYKGFSGNKSEEQYSIFQNQFGVKKEVEPLIFGDPNSPSLVMNQGGLNLGMSIMPTSNTNYVSKITRNQTSYAKIKSSTNRVRGHPFALEQTQHSLDKKRTFDNDSRTYTDESDSTKSMGGISTFRYNRIERPSIKKKRRFLQVNINPKLGPMKIVQPDDIHFKWERRKKGTYRNIRLDNRGIKDYRNIKPPKKMGKQKYQQKIGEQDYQKNPYIKESVRKQYDSFDSKPYEKQKGFQFPPMSPIIHQHFESNQTIQKLLPEDTIAGITVSLNGKNYYVVKVLSITNKGKMCELQEIPESSFPGINEYGSFFSKTTN